VSEAGAAFTRPAHHRSEVVVKVQATVLLTFQAKSLAEAGAVLDDVLARARERDDVDVGRVEVASPPGDRAVTLPPIPAPAGYPPQVPPRAISGNGS
jgi:hypothetical protein